MSETSSKESKASSTTIKINESIFLDASTNMVILVVDRVTLTLTLQEYIQLATNVIGSTTHLQNFIAIKSSLTDLYRGQTIVKSFQSGSSII